MKYILIPILLLIGNLYFCQNYDRASIQSILHSNLNARFILHDELFKYDSTKLSEHPYLNNSDSAKSKLGFKVWFEKDLNNDGILDLIVNGHNLNGFVVIFFDKKGNYSIQDYGKEANNFEIFAKPIQLKNGKNALIEFKLIHMNREDRKKELTPVG